MMKIITSIKYLIDKTNQAKQFFSKEVTTENSKGQIINIKWMDENDEVSLEFDNFYDKNGQLEKYTQYHPAINLKKIWEIERDAQNRIATVNFRTSENHPKFNYGKTNYTYAPDSKSVEIIEQELGEVPSRRKKYFDENGKVIKETEFDEDMEIVCELRYRYYNNGQREEMDYFGRGGSVLQSRSCYNPGGEIIKKEFYLEEKEVETFIYQYNKEGFWIERRTLKNDKLHFLEQREISTII